MKLLVPCCGSSSRYPKQPPKWLLPGSDGQPMIAKALSLLDVNLDDVVVIILQKHEDQFNVTAGLAKVFGRPIRTVVLAEPTKSQSETVAKALRALAWQGSFFVKDSDNVFAIDDLDQSVGYVCYESLNNFDRINPRNKSYIQTDEQEYIINIREKRVISDRFSVGGYFFGETAPFLAAYDRLTAQSQPEWKREIFISDIISSMILDGAKFQARPVTKYQDWGTDVEWKAALLARKAYFVSLDGFIFQRGSAFFKPTFEDVPHNPQAVDTVKRLVAEGHHIAYVSIRPEAYAELTRQKMRALGLPIGPIVWDCPIAQWILLTSPHETMPFSTAKSFELNPATVQWDDIDEA